MDKPISVGDLVVVVKPRMQCGCVKSIGRIFQVTEITLVPTYCLNCNKYDDIQYSVAMSSEGIGCPLFRLKRIPPLDELEGEKCDEKLTEPA